MYKSFVLVFDSPYDAFLCSSLYNLCRISNYPLTSLNYNRFLVYLSENFSLDPAVLEYDSNEVLDKNSCYVELFVLE